MIPDRAGRSSRKPRKERRRRVPVGTRRRNDAARRRGSAEPATGGIMTCTPPRGGARGLPGADRRAQVGSGVGGGAADHGGRREEGQGAGRADERDQEQRR